MITIINPRDFLLQLKNNSATTLTMMPSDLLEIPELNLTLLFSKALEPAEFYDTLKKATSDFNSNATLNGKPPIDFDDLYTKYSEYIEVLKTVIQQSD